MIILQNLFVKFHYTLIEIVLHNTTINSYNFGLYSRDYTEESQEHN